MTARHVTLVIGTRPEAIKMAPVYRALARSPDFVPRLVSSGQHRELLAGALQSLELKADDELGVMRAGQTPNEVLARVLEGLGQLWSQARPDLVLVQGDTTTVLGAALAAYHLGIPVGHVEAGLRTYDHQNPFPEEANRQLADRLCRWCFAPTPLSRDNLLSERIDSDRIFVTGNTAVDSLLWAAERSQQRLPPNTLLVTLHRRESFGEKLESILLGVRDFLAATPDARAVWPVHPNPNVTKVAQTVLSDRFQLIAPMEYVPFAGALASCRLVLSDSGGIQEEAPSLGKRVLVARETTERPEAVEAGINRIVGRTREGVREALTVAWSEQPYTGSLPAPNPYGDGHAAEHILDVLRSSPAA